MRWLAGCRRGALLPCAAQQTDEKQDASMRQMLGMKGAAEETDLFKIRVQLTKPVTWVPLIWGEQQPVHTHRYEVVPSTAPSGAAA